MEKNEAVAVVAGVDPTGQAGLARDLAALNHFGVRHGFVVSAFTLQTARKVFSITPRPIKEFERDLRFLRPNIWKIGMLPSADHVRAVARRIKNEVVVLDPIYRASSGGALTTDEAYAEMMRLLMPLSIVTPNLEEFSLLEGTARALIVKGGHGDGTDTVVTPEKVTHLRGKLLPAAIRGSGCAFASALAANLALGRDLVSAARAAKAYVRLLLRAQAAGRRLQPGACRKVCAHPPRIPAPHERF